MDKLWPIASRGRALSGVLAFVALYVVYDESHSTGDGQNQTDQENMYGSHGTLLSAHDRALFRIDKM